MSQDAEATIKKREQKHQILGSNRFPRGAPRPSTPVGGDATAAWCNNTFPRKNALPNAPHRPRVFLFKKTIHIFSAPTQNVGGAKVAIRHNKTRHPAAAPPPKILVTLKTIVLQTHFFRQNNTNKNVGAEGRPLQKQDRDSANRTRRPSAAEKNAPTTDGARCQPSRSSSTSPLRTGTELPFSELEKLSH